MWDDSRLPGSTKFPTRFKRRTGTGRCKACGQAERDHTEWMWTQHHAALAANQRKQQETRRVIRRVLVR